MSTSIIGREPELAAIRSFVEAVADGPGVLVIEGEAGIGKTTVWRAGAQAAEDRGFRVLRAGPAESEARLSFAALDDLLGGLLEEASADLPEPQRRALAVALLREPATGPAPERAVAAAFLGALRKLAASEPLLVAVDDIQWLDTPSAAALAYAVRRLDAERVGFLLTHRVAGGDPAALGLDRPVRPALIRVRVEALSLAATNRMLHEHLGLDLPRPTLRRLHDSAAGNPFYSLELGRSLEGGVRPGEPLPVPEQTRFLVQERLSGMPPETIDALLAAALLAEPTLQQVSSAAGRDVEPALEMPLRERVVDVRAGRIRFTHPLFAAGVVQLAAPERRRALHRRLAATAPQAEQRARHLALGTDGCDPSVAAALDEAAHAVAARGAPETAAELADLARQLTPPEQIEAAWRRAIDTAGYAWAAGDAERALMLLTQAAADAPPGPVHSLALARLLRLTWFTGNLQAATGLFRALLEEAGDDVALAAEAHEALAWVRLVVREDVAEVAELARTAVALAEQVGSRPMLAESLAVLALSEFLLGGGLPSAAMERAMALEPGLEVSRVMRLPSPHSWMLLAGADRLDEARAVLEEAFAAAAAIGDESSPPWILMRLSHVELLAGNWQRAADEVDRAWELAHQTGHRAPEVAVVGTRALVEAHRGNEPEAREAAAEALRLAEANGHGMTRCLAMWALGALDVGLGNLEAGARVLGELWQWNRRAGIVEPGENRYLGDLIEALTGLGRLDEAERLVCDLAQRGEALRRDSALAIAGRGRAMLLSAAGDHEAALGELESALRRHPEALPFERARTLLVQGSVQRRLRRSGDARASLEAARDGFISIGAPAWQARAASELARIGGRTRSPDGLTPAEKRVAGLVAQGHTNREVAAALFVTDRTVESHLSRIYSKLHVRSRSELARGYRESP